MDSKRQMVDWREHLLCVDGDHWVRDDHDHPSRCPELEPWLQPERQLVR